jgi:hypothetical protein
MTGHPPPPDVQEAAAKVQAWLDQQKPAASAVTRAPETAIDRFKRTARPDDPPVMPPWSAASITPGLDLRAADRFLQQRRDRPDKPVPMPEWKDPRV